MSDTYLPNEKTPYLIHCIKDEDFGSCGASTYLTEEEYNQQITNPDIGWRCPKCNCHPCSWDDKNYEDSIKLI